MKKIENSFAVTGFIGKDAEIRSFETVSVARFSIAISRADKTGEETSYVSAASIVFSITSLSCIIASNVYFARNPFSLKLLRI